MLYLIPVYLGENSSNNVFPQETLEVIQKTQHYIVENEKSARRFLKFIYPEIDQESLVFRHIGKGFKREELSEVVQDLQKVESVGLLSEAGTPCIADPGYLIVNWAHQNHIKVHPLVGPSSIYLALMASGMNGQNFEFHGYLPIDKNERKRKLKELEKESSFKNKTQIFMETPYRNRKLVEDLISTLQNNTQLCIATHVSLPDESIVSQAISLWRNHNIDIHKKPSIFLIQAY